MRDLVQAVVAGEFPEGSRLPGEDELGFRFGAGRSVLRDALLTLELRGLVAVRPGRGRLVCQREDWDTRDPVVLWACLERGPEPELLAQTIDARAAIERLAVAHAVEFAADGDVRLLAARVDEMDHALAPGSVRTFDGDDPLVQAETDFHAMLALLSENPALAKLTKPLHEPLARWRRVHAPDRDRAVVQHHRRIVEGLSAREPALAEDAVTGYARQIVRWLGARR